MKNFFLNDLSEKCKRNKKLFNVMFVLLSACNQNCVHCYIPEHKNIGLSTEKIKSLIDEARELGALNVTFTGGECFLRTDIYELIKYARDRFMRVFIMSNASYISKKDIEKLKDLNISGFSTTLFSMDEKTHDTITQKNGSFKITMQNIMELKEAGIDVTVKTPLMEINKNAYKDVEKFAELNNFSFKTTATIFSKIGGDESPHDLEIKNGLCDIVKDIDAINKKYEGYAGEKSAKTDIPCSAGFSNVCINYDGDVWPCNTLTLKVGNVNQNSLKKIWQNSKILKDWRKNSVKPLATCENCKLKSKCIRCPGLAYMENNDLYGCSSSAKKLAEVR